MKLSISSNIKDTGPAPDEIRSGSYSDIEIDLSNITFFDPSTLARVKCIIELTRQHDLKVSIIPPSKEGAKDYAGRMDLFEGTTYEYPHNKKFSSKFFPLLKITDDRNDTLHEKCRKIFSGAASDSLADVFTEIADNIYYHSGKKENSGWGYVHAQTYDSDKFIKIAVSDVGIGFLESYRRLRRDNGRTEAKIIQDAFNELESSLNPETGPCHRGIGLHDVLTFTKENRGKFCVFSGQSCIEFSVDAGFKSSALDYTVCGVLFEIEVPIK